MFAALGLHCCTGFSLVTVLLTAVVSRVAEHEYRARGLQQLWHMGSAVAAPGSQVQAQ